MREFQEKRKLRKIIFSKTTLVLLLFISFFLVFSTIKIYFKNRNVLSKNEKIKNELAQLNQRKSELEKEISRLGTESGIEEEVREKFDLLKPGEKVVVIVDKNQENDKINLGEETGFFGKILSFIKNIF
ncbi:MAG: septum formation initiator family protein [Candidatus Terrybacteria bacterium]|nr:septum formation initiator family protein [Candidatus Terrybacteria bacterium]